MKVPDYLQKRIKPPEYYYEMIAPFEKSAIPDIYKDALPKPIDYESEDNWKAWWLFYVLPTYGADDIIKGQYEKFLNITSNFVVAVEGFLSDANKILNNYQPVVSDNLYYEKFDEYHSHIYYLINIMPKLLKDDKRMGILKDSFRNYIYEGGEDDYPALLHYENTKEILEDFREIIKNVERQWKAIMKTYEKYVSLKYEDVV